MAVQEVATPVSSSPNIGASQQSGAEAEGMRGSPGAPPGVPGADSRASANSAGPGRGRSGGPCAGGARRLAYIARLPAPGTAPRPATPSSGPPKPSPRISRTSPRGTTTPTPPGVGSQRPRRCRAPSPSADGQRADRGGRGHPAPGFGPVRRRPRREADRSSSSASSVRRGPAPHAGQGDPGEREPGQHLLHGNLTAVTAGHELHASPRGASGAVCDADGPRRFRPGRTTARSRPRPRPQAVRCRRP